MLYKIYFPFAENLKKVNSFFIGREKSRMLEPLIIWLVRNIFNMNRNIFGMYRKRPWIVRKVFAMVQKKVYHTPKKAALLPKSFYPGYEGEVTCSLETG